MKTVEIKVLDGTVYTLKESLSAGDAIEYIKTFIAKDDAVLPDGEVTKEKTVSTFFRNTCKNMEDAEWLTQHVVVAKPPISVPLHHAYELLEKMRESVRFVEFMKVAESMRTTPDPDFPEDESKN